MGLLFFSFPFFFWLLMHCALARAPSFESGFDQRASCRGDGIDLPFELFAGSIECMLRTGFMLFVSAVSGACAKKQTIQTKYHSMH